MNGYAFQKNTRFEFEGAAYLVQRVNGDKSVVAERIDDGYVSRYELNELLDSFSEGRIKFLPASNSGDERPLCVRPTINLDEATQEELDRRLSYVSAIRDAAPLVHTPEMLTPLRDEVAKKIDDKRPPSFTTLYRWLRTASHYDDFKALIPRYDLRGSKQHKQDPRVIELFEQAADVAYAASPAANVQEVRSVLEQLIKEENTLRPSNLKYKLPSNATCYRMFARLDQYEQDVWKKGKRIADREFKLSGPGVNTSRILERVEIDHTPVDIFLVDEQTNMPLGRPTLTMIIDHFSRMPLGYHLGFNAPSAMAVLGALRHAILRKKKYETTGDLVIETDWPCFGVPECIVVDNGLEFHGKAIDRLAFNLGMRIQYCPKKEPQFKGVIERYFRTVNYSFVHQLPGTSLSHFHKRGDHDPEEHALLTLAEFRELFEKWLLDVYARKTHRSLKTTPLAKWQQSAEVYTPRLPKDVEQLTLNVGQHCERDIRHYGIELHGLLYSSVSLAPLIRRYGTGVKVTVTYDPNNIGSIWVCDPDSNETLLVAHAKEFDYANGLSLEQHKLIRREVTKQGDSTQDLAALGRAKQAIRERIKELRHSKKHSHRRFAARMSSAEEESAKELVTLERNASTKSSKRAGSPNSSNDELPKLGERAPLSIFTMHRKGGL